ncbi:MAG: MFS transporter [Actinomycetota bacterium]|nr:MFS transporter [Actinomycetota bacterium]
MTVRSVSNHRSVLLILAIGTFIVGTDGFVLNGLLPDIARDLDVSEAAAGQLATIFAITYAIASPVIAGATGTWDRKILLIGGMGLFTIGMVGQAIGATYLIVAVARVLAAIGAAAFQSTAYVVAGALSPPERRGRALSTVAAGMSVSMVLGVPLGVYMGQWTSWRTTMWLIAAVGVVVGLVVLRVPSVRVPAVALRDRLRTAVQPAVTVVLLITVLAAVGSFAVFVYIPLIVAPSATGAALVWVLAVAGVGQVLGNSLTGSGTDRFGSHRMRLVSLGGSVVTLLSLNLAAPSLWSNLVAWLAFGTFTGMLMVAQQHRLLSVAPQASIVALGLNGSAIYLGSGIGALVGGAVLSGWGVGWLSPIAGAAAAAALITAVLFDRKSKVLANT